MKSIEKVFEQILWNSRLVVIVSVVASLLGAFAMFLIATIDAGELLFHVGHYVLDELGASERGAYRSEIVGHLVEVIDGYLLGTVMLIFSLGLYELFISTIDAAENSELGAQILVIHSLDDLKSRLGKLVLMILIVRFFERALVIEFATALEGLYIGGAIALIGLALYLSHAGEHGKGKGEAH